jgi:hypothetical protein
MTTRRRLLKAAGASGVFLTGTGTAAADETARSGERSQLAGTVADLSGRIDVFATGGQSNAKGIGDASRSPNPRSGTAYEFENATGNVVELDDPVGTGQYEAFTGSAWPAFAEKYYSRTGRKTAIIPTAVGGSAQVAGVRENNHWDAGGARRGAAVNIIDQGMNALRNEGFEPRLRGMLWSQGESDAQAITNGQITIGDYKQAFSEMLGYFRNNIRNRFPLWLFQTGKPSTGDTTGFQKIRSAQADFPTTKRDVQMVSWVQKVFPDKGWIAPHQVSTQEVTILSHVYHYSQRGYNVMGRTGAENLNEVPFLTNTLSIESTAGTDRAEYRFTVEGDLEKSTATGADRNSADTISGQTASGYVTSGLDSYVFSGGIERFDLDGTAAVFLNGDRIDPEKYSGSVLSVRATSNTNKTNYQFTVEGDLEKSTANGADLNSADTISGQTATGYVTSGLDSYTFSGGLEAFDLDGRAYVTLNGEPAHVGQRPDHALTIEGAGPRADYFFSVGNDLAKSTANGADLNSADTISGQTATGYTTSGLDSYTFSGGLEAFDLDGRASVTLDGEPAYVGQLPDNVLSIRSNANTDRADYEFTVESDLTKSTANGADLNSADTISGQTATGYVTSGLDSYTFAGELQKFDLNGNADVFLNGEIIISK